MCIVYFPFLQLVNGDDDDDDDEYREKKRQVGTTFHIRFEVT